MASSTDARITAMTFGTSNGQVYEDSSDEEPEARMRVGDMYQAQVPNWDYDQLPTFTSKDCDAMAAVDVRVWSPMHEIPDEKVEAYCKIAKEKHGYNVEQALGLLYWHKHDIEKSLKDMANYTPMPEDWSVEDKVLFEQAYTFHGKSFRRIQQLLPDKEINQLVKYYYLWKKTRMKTSLMDRQARKLNKNMNGSDESDCESSHLTYLQGKTQLSEKMRIAKGDQTTNVDDSNVKHKLPKGVNLDLKGLSEITGFPGGPEKYLKKQESNITTLKSQIQVDKQHWSLLCQEMKGLDCYRDLMQTAPKEEGNSQTWSTQELLLAVQGVRRYGKDFQAISEVLGTKSAPQVKTFFVSQRRRFNLDQVLKEYEEAEASSGNRDGKSRDEVSGAADIQV